jgi:hypothetical protein
VTQGAGAASDAVNQARVLGIAPGSPIYFDMESYARGAGATAVVLQFLSGWTQRLHALGYQSGVYSSQTSGVRDLVTQYGTSYGEPDDLWFADWNGRPTIATGRIPDHAWGDHQRLHQYSGGVNESHGGVTLNIDGNYVDGATAVAAAAEHSRRRHPQRFPWTVRPFDFLTRLL